jgi:hypothetical protein
MTRTVRSVLVSRVPGRPGAIDIFVDMVDEAPADGEIATLPGVTPRPEPIDDTQQQRQRRSRA